MAWFKNTQTNVVWRADNNTDLKERLEKDNNYKRLNKAEFKAELTKMKQDPTGDEEEDDDVAPEPEEKTDVKEEEKEEKKDQKGK
jgi:hypothetical protein